jgi:hypothetical protein
MNPKQWIRKTGMARAAIRDEGLEMEIDKFEVELDRVVANAGTVSDLNEVIERYRHIPFMRRMAMQRAAIDTIRER